MAEIQPMSGLSQSPPLSKKWWLLKGDEAASAVFGTVRYLQSNQAARRNQFIVSTRLYGNLSIMGMNGLSYSKLASVSSAQGARVTYNVCQAAVDTAQAKMAKNKPKPLFLTSGGDYKLQRKAKKLTKFVEGVFYENDAFTLGASIFRDAEIWGTGIIHVFVENDRIKYEREIMSELYVDEVEAFNGAPRSLHKVRPVDRGVLKQLFPNKKSAIDDADEAKPDDLSAFPTVSDQVVVVESWHLPSGPEAKDGRHIIALNGHELFSEDYTADFFPFVFFHWNKRQFGFWGQGLVEQIQNIQLEINKLLWVIQRSMYLQGSFKVLLENGSKIVKEHLNHDIGAIITYTGPKPEYVIPPMVQPEVYQHLQTLKNAAFEQAGISQLSAAAKKPEGLDSGKALREYNDIESDRFMVVGQNYETLFMDLARLTIAVAKDLFGKSTYKVQVPSKKFVETIDWKDVHMEEDEYVLKVYPISALSDSPQDRLQDVQELMQAGLIDPDTGRRLLEYPDLEAEESLADAETEYLHMILDKILDCEDDELDECYTPPEPFDNLAEARKLALEYYARGKLQGVEEDRLEMFRRFLSQIDLLEQSAQPPMPPQAPPGAAGQPQAQPAPPPVSNMIPNVPGVQS